MRFYEFSKRRLRKAKSYNRECRHCGGGLSLKLDLEKYVINVMGGLGVKMYEIKVKITDKEHEDLKKVMSLEDIGRVFNNAYQRGDWEEKLK